MKRVSLILTFILVTVLSFEAIAQQEDLDHIETDTGPLTVQPIQHGTLVLSWDNQHVYVDPTGGAEAFEDIDDPDMILITHTHGDHMDVETLQVLETENTTIVVPQSVADVLSDEFTDQLVILANGEDTDYSKITVRAVPMYNLPDDESARHSKGWGNGYVMNFGGKNVYISGDTEDIPEMRSLENIDVAFVCMNLPYTMDIYQAASAVLDFEPDIIYPYHHRGQDIERFKEIVTKENEVIDVRLRDWYPE